MASGIDRYLNEIKTQLLNNDTLCKFLYYDNRNPLASPDLLDNSIILTDKLNQKLFFTPYSEDTDLKAKSTINIVVDEFKLDSKTKYYKDLKIEFIIMVHHDIWLLDDGSGEIKLRPNAIWYEINNMFDKSRTGIGTDTFEHSNLIRSKSGYYSGYRYCLKTKDIPLLTK